MSLLRRVEHYLKRTRTSPTRFGRAALNDSRFVFDLRTGRQVTERVEGRVQAWIDSQYREQRLMRRVDLALRASARRRGRAG